MTTSLAPKHDGSNRLDPGVEASLRARIAKLERINKSLMTHVERATDQHEGAYSLFQTAIMLEGRVRARTEELTALMHSIERSNEALKAAKEEAERANRSKTKFLAAASHDLLQPLNAARLSLSALGGLPVGADVRSLTNQAERGLQTIEDLIKTLLDISKLDAGVVRPIKKPVRLLGIMAGIEESFRPIAEQEGLRFIIRCPDIGVESDIVLLHRVIQNLVSNALRYTRTGGVLVAARTRGQTCRIDVVDTGPGIPESERELVFEEFYRGKGAAEGGLGLGLSIVRRMASALDHRLVLRSRLGRGTSFRVELPVAVRAWPEAETTVPGDVSNADAHVLVIENDPATRTALTRLLQSWSLRVSACKDIAEWEADPTRQPPTLVIVDYHLDDGAIGLDAVARLRGTISPNLPAVVVTADHSEAVEALVIEARCELTHKPVKPAQLRSLLSFLIQAAHRGTA